jgi:hypothetical protein
VLATNYRKLIAWTIGASLLVFMGEMFIYGLTGMSTTYSTSRMLWDFAEIGAVLMTLITVIWASSVVSSINDKRRRETFMMLPSSNLEKFLSLVFYTTVIGVLCMFLAFVVGDTLRMAAVWGDRLISVQEAVGEVYNYNGIDETYYTWSSSVPWMLSKLIPRLITVWTSGIYWTWENEWSTLIYHVVLAVWIHSVYTLGGTLLRKYAFVATSVVLLAVVAVFTNIQSHLGLGIYNWVDHIQRGITTTGVIIGIVLLIISVLNYRTSFRVFKGFQLITNKWTNYDLLKR